MEGKKEWEPRKPAEYTQKLSRNQVSYIFKARTRMLQVKANYKNGNKELKCRLCKEKEETQTHILEECVKLKDSCQEVTKDMIFEENIEELKQTAKLIETRMKVLEEKQQETTL